MDYNSFLFKNGVIASFRYVFVVFCFLLVIELKETIILFLQPGAVLGVGAGVSSLNYLEISIFGDGA